MSCFILFPLIRHCDTYNGCSYHHDIFVSFQSHVIAIPAWHRLLPAWM